MLQASQKTGYRQITIKLQASHKQVKSKAQKGYRRVKKRLQVNQKQVKSRSQTGYKQVTNTLKASKKTGYKQITKRQVPHENVSAVWYICVWSKDSSLCKLQNKPTSLSKINLIQNSSAISKWSARRLSTQVETKIFSCHFSERIHWMHGVCGIRWRVGSKYPFVS